MDGGTTDRELIADVIKGHPGAADEFYERYHRLVYAILRDMRLQPDDAEDVFSDVFERLWKDGFRRLQQWQGRGQFSSYLATVTRHLALDHLRKHPEASIRYTGNADEESEANDPPGPGPGPARLLEVKELQEAVRTAREQLKARDRELIERKHDLEQSYSQIAAAMSMTANNVGVALSRAEARLRNILSAQFPELFRDGD